MKNEPHGNPTDAYRIFFPLGILVGIAGVLIWPLYYFRITSGYSGRAHMFVQADGFLYAFVVGFLWTAIPRFTGTRAPSRGIQYALAGSLLVIVGCFEFEFFVAAHTLFVIAHITTIAVIAQRFVRRQLPPPPTFALVGAGMLCGLMGAVINAGIALGWIFPRFDALGRRSLTEGMILLLVLGVGGFLGPRLLGFAQLPNLQNMGDLAKQSRPPYLVRYGTIIYACAGFAIIGSLVVEYAWNGHLMAWLRAAIGTALIVSSIQPWRLPAIRTTLAWCVWLAHWFLIAGLWIAAASLKYRVDLLHIIFMGGFTLLILAVGTRVVLSHGNHALTEERKSWPLRIGLTTGLIALLARLGAPFAPNSYFSHLAWAAILWIAGMVFWGAYLWKRVRGTR